MVRDAYAAGGQPQLADGNSSTANLTQELAQLLAQSIAQGQSGRRPPGAAATGSELASLAALVSASQNQRQPYKDGLSSLSYARPAQGPPLTPALAPVPAPAAPGMLITEPQHDDEPMPIPSTWRQPMLSDDDRWYRQQLGAAALGLIAGLIVVVPAVLWLSGFLGGPQPQKGPRPAVAEQPPAVKIAEVRHVKDVRPTRADPPPAPPPVERAAPAPVPKPETRTAAMLAPPPKVVPPPKVEPVKSRAEDLLNQAKRLIQGGDIAGAREVLEAPETASSGQMMFMLAETYDPSMLASWQTRGINADPQKARHFYQKALALGDSRAEQRLRADWLGQN